MKRTGRSSGTCSPFQAVEAQPLRAEITDESDGRTRLAPPTEGGPRQVHGTLQSRLQLYYGAYQSEMEQDTRDPAVDSGEEIPTVFRKKSEMTSLETSPRRQTCLLRAGALQNDRRSQARTSPLHHPEIHRLATQFSALT